MVDMGGGEGIFRGPELYVKLGLLDNKKRGHHM